jgi:hypothetical protein
MTAEFGDFKGNKVIILKRDGDDQYPFSFGKNKARLIVENYDKIKKSRQDFVFCGKRGETQYGGR